MKPLIYFDFESVNDKDIIISKKRLQEIVTEVYQAGYEDGERSKPYLISTPVRFTCGSVTD